jgi:hypothetical protein
MVSVVVRSRVAWIACAIAILISSWGCRREPTEVAQPEETLSRTEFTERIENFFEHEPLKPGKSSAFLIHLTDLSDGAPVEKADVTLTVRPSGGSGGTPTKAKIGRVTGIYVADVTVPAPGTYTVEFRVVTRAFDERMVLDDFKAE